MRRRTLIKSGLTVSAGLCLNKAFLAASFDRHRNENYSFQLGSFKCTVLLDFHFSYKAKEYFSNVDHHEAEMALKAYHQTPESIPSPFISLLIEKDDLRILIDSGVGLENQAPELHGSTINIQGHLLERLRKEKVDPKSINYVILTHFHPDHIGGLCHGKGEFPFTNATYIFHQKEWDHWISKNLTMPPLFAYFINKNIRPLKDQDVLLLSKEQEEVLPGISVIRIPGHTPGQVAVYLQSDGNQLLYISDVWLHPLHIQNLDWQTSFDLDHQLARQSREHMLQLAYRENILVQSFHFPFPGLGHIDKISKGWNWVPTTNCRVPE